MSTYPQKEQQQQAVVAVPVPREELFGLLQAGSSGSGCAVLIPPNSLCRANGTPFHGAARVSFAVIDADDPAQLAGSFPGDFASLPITAASHAKALEKAEAAAAAAIDEATGGADKSGKKKKRTSSEAAAVAARKKANRMAIKQARAKFLYGADHVDEDPGMMEVGGEGADAPLEPFSAVTAGSFSGRAPSSQEPAES